MTSTKKTTEDTAEQMYAVNQNVNVESNSPPNVSRLMFGVDSKVKSNTILQNNLTEFEWVVRNKLYPSFWGRYIVGKDALDKDEINFLHHQGCPIAIIYDTSNTDFSEEHGILEAEKAIDCVKELDIPTGTAIFLEISEICNVPCEYMRGYAQTLIDSGYTPGFKANTDAKFTFDREFSIGMQNHKDIFKECLIWAVSPSLTEYDRITTSHLISPDNWKPFAPSSITRRDIAVWQYGKNCHPIEDDNENETTFNVNLIRNDDMFFDKIY